MRVDVDGVVLPPEAYQINLHLGTIRFRTTFPRCARGRVLPASPVLSAPVYSLRPRRSRRPRSWRRRPVASRPRRPSPGCNQPRIRRHQVGIVLDRHQPRPTLDQSLEATVEGKLTPTISVRALLSDNNLPIQPEGNTEDLEYFDRVFVEVEGPRARAAVGDISLDDRTSTLLAVGSPAARILGCGLDRARSRQRGGRGDQGRISQRDVSRHHRAAGTLPAALAGAHHLATSSSRAPSACPSTVSRSSAVPTATTSSTTTPVPITFTPRRLITSDTEIAVDFEVTAENYGRTTLLGGAERVQLGRGVRDECAVRTRGGRQERPQVGVDLAPGRRRIESRGRRRECRHHGRCRARGPRQGQLRAGAGRHRGGCPAHFRFDELLGDYQVSFVEVDANAGDYRRAGISSRGTPYFEFVGANLGSLLSSGVRCRCRRRSTSPPRAWRASEVTFTFDGEWNVSQYDRNRFRRWTTTTTWARRRSARDRTRTRQGDWRLGVSGLGSILDDRFQSFDRARPAYYYRDWNLEDVALGGARADGRRDARRGATTRGTCATRDPPRPRRLRGVKHEALIEPGGWTIAG